MKEISPKCTKNRTLSHRKQSPMLVLIVRPKLQGVVGVADRWEEVGEVHRPVVGEVQFLMVAVEVEGFQRTAAEEH